MHRRLHSHPVRLCFQGVVLHYGSTVPKWVPHPACALLQNVRQFVAQKLLPVNAVRIVITGRKVDVRTPGECDCSNRSYFRANVNADVRKIRSHGRFHLRLYFLRQAPATILALQVDLKRIYARGQFALNGAASGLDRPHALD